MSDNNKKIDDYKKHVEEAIRLLSVEAAKIAYAHSEADVNDIAATLLEKCGLAYKFMREKADEIEKLIEAQ